MDSKSEMNPMSEEVKELAEQLPSVVKSHLPLHLQPKTKKPLESSTGVNTTPAVVKRRQMNKWFNSPTDAFLSPCTQKLMKPKGLEHPIQVLDLDENEDQKQMTTQT